MTLVRQLRFGAAGCCGPAGAIAPAAAAGQALDRAHEEDLKMQAFPEAAEGIRALDLLHGKQNLQLRLCTQSCWKLGLFERVPTAGDFPAFHGKSD